MKIDQIKEFYTNDSKQYNDRWIKKGGDYSNRSQIKIVKKLTSSWKNQKILEIGCGTGRFSDLLAQSNPEMVFMDLSNVMITITLNKVGRLNKGINASAYEIPLPKNSIEAVLSINVFNHIEDIPKAIIEVNRVLEDHGEFVVNFTNLYSYYYLAGYIVNRQQKSIGRTVYSQWLNPRTIFNLLERNGFKIIETIGNVFVPIHLDVPIIRDLIYLLDKISTHSILRYFAPTMFIKSQKIKNVSKN